MIDDVIIVAVLAAVGGGAIASFVSGLFQSPKTRAEAAKLIAEQGQTIDGRWEKLSNELDERLTKERAEHREELDELRVSAQREVQKLHARLERVEEQLQDSRLTVQALRIELDESEQVAGRVRMELNREKQVTRSVIGWAVTLRDEIRRLGGVVPDTPRMVVDYINEMNDPPDETDTRNIRDDTPEPLA